MDTPLSYSGAPITAYVDIEFNRHGDIALPPYLPDPGLVNLVNKALETESALLLTGDDMRPDYASVAIAYDLFGNQFDKYYFPIIIYDEQQRFEDFLFTYDYDLRDRDLHYYSITQNKAYLRDPAYYLKKGPLVRLVEMMSQTKEKAYLEISGFDYASEELKLRLLDFVFRSQLIFIHESQEEIVKEIGMIPITCILAKNRCELPKPSIGVVYQYKTTVSEATLIQEILLRYQGLEADWLEPMISKEVKLYYLLKNSTLLNQNDNYPDTLIELYSSIDFKLKTLYQGDKNVNDYFEELDKIINDSLKIADDLDLEPSIEKIKEMIGRADWYSVISNLDLLKSRFSADAQIQIDLLKSRHAALVEREQMQIESDLTLYPKRNKLTFDFLSLLDKLLRLEV